MWDPAQYLRHSDERARPFLDLTARIGADEPRHVADLGCGPGNLTALLARRWPSARVVGIDSSAEMIEAAAALPEAASVSFEAADVRDWRPATAPDVITCNAVLQWIPSHDGLVVSWADMLAPGGWLALQLPGNRTSPCHLIATELARSPRWRGLLADAELNQQAGDPAGYVRLLGRPGFAVDVWETAYLHLLRPSRGAHGESPVVEWTKGSTLRPLLSVLDDEQAADFTAEYAELVSRAYETGPFGTIFPFRRVFAVAHRR
jgi:trans-aconitate 2-methyltransferase